MVQLRAWATAWLRRRRGSVARFPFGQQGDPLLTMLQPHAEAVAVASVVGSVDRYQQLDRTFRPYGGMTSRLRGIIQAMNEGVSFPPIVVYRLHGACYIVDGHHRVAAALATGQLYLDAMVTDCIVPVEGTEHRLEEAQVQFGLRTGLHVLAFSEPERYEQALAQINEHRWYLSERGPVVRAQEAAADWYDNIYLPVVRQAIAERLAPTDSAQAIGDFYLQLCDLKYGVSRERGHDIGFAGAIREWAANRRAGARARVLGRLLGLSVVS